MSNEIRAFPVVGEYENQFTGGTESVAQFGMTLRDWFAGQALAGRIPGWVNGSRDQNAIDVADWSYCLADAMMEARKGNVK